MQVTAMQWNTQEKAFFNRNPFLKNQLWCVPLVGTTQGRLFFGPFEKNSRPRKLKPQENNSKLKQKTQVSAKFD